MTTIPESADPTCLIDDPIQAARAVFDTVRRGGVAIFRTDVGYAVVGHGPDAIARIYRLKKRSAAKPCGCFASRAILDSLIMRDARADALVQAVVGRHDLPLSVVGRYDAGHPLISGAPAAVRPLATKGETIDLLMNAGPIHDEIARLSLDAGMAVFGSSANASLAGSKFRFQDIEPEVRSGVDLAVDSGPTRYAHPAGLGSTIIDLDSMEPFRIGIHFDAIRDIARRECGIDIPQAVRAA
ncbi:MAG: Sua5/YciO/YrdC/YwlC family protein [Pararhodobacter sp.]